MSASSGVAVALLVIAGGTATAAGRSPEASEAERRSVDLEMEVVRKKVTALEAVIDLRARHLRDRLRVLYKLSQGGYLPLLSFAEEPRARYARRDGAARVVRRDLDELGLVKRELGEVAAEREQLLVRERRAEAQNALGVAAPTGRLTHKNALQRPVRGAVVARFGPWRDLTTGIWRTLDGIELAAHHDETVRAVADGAVLAVEDLPGLGRSVIFDHGDGFVSLLGRLRMARVAAGDKVKRGQHVGEAAGGTVQLQFAEDGIWLDPTSWLSH